MAAVLVLEAMDTFLGASMLLLLSSVNFNFPCMIVLRNTKHKNFIIHIAGFQKRIEENGLGTPPAAWHGFADFFLPVLA